jgi:hypothetical protein
VYLEPKVLVRDIKHSVCFFCRLRRFTFGNCILSICSVFLFTPMDVLFISAQSACCVYRGSNDSEMVNNLLLLQFFNLIYNKYMNS